MHAVASRGRAVADESRVQELLDEISDSGCTPEEVCDACPELLPEVRRRWQQMCAVKTDLHAPSSPRLLSGGCQGVVTPQGYPL